MKHSTTTKRRKKPGQETGLLKALLLTGAVAATLVGTRVLAIQDNLDQNVQPANDIAVFENGRTSPATTNSINNFAPDRPIVLDLQPVPQTLQPNIQSFQQIRPMIRTRSS